MKEVKTMLRAGAVMILALWPSHTMASDTGLGPPPPSAYHEVSFTLGLAMDAKAISLKGILSYAGGSSRGGGAADVRTKSIEIASAPNVFARVRQGIVVLRALGRATECVVAHCWRELLKADEATER